ncbi:MAG: ribonuclease R [Desulfuromonas sp.]|uniref:ribonuclease R n=1 Tax=Desulfuromonas sp. TaxID=892 RepID=UPI000CB9AAB5|nr:ribonuclease R [Desulfuromonas sp.]PLX85718.1 MAG: ribonuclease R [Desulfuromonas sp.]
MPISPADILKILEKGARRPLTAREILGHLELPRGERQEAVRLLDELAREGVLVSLKGGRFSLPRKVNLVTGPLSVHPEGYGFVSPGDTREGDVFIPGRFLGEAMHGDRVVARVEPGRLKGKSEGRIIRVLERAHQTVVGRFESGDRFGYVVPADPRLHRDIFIPPASTGEARPGQVVVVRLDSFPGKNRNPEGTVVEVLGDAGDPAVEILTIVHKFSLPHTFPSEVEGELPGVPSQVSPSDYSGREDLRDLVTVTIDGESARDFDDAVAVRRETGGRIRLWVSIADVGHYVPEGSAIDREALERGTSVYFPGRCIPMLPEKLSNGICSLNPGVERLAMTAEIVFDEEGNRLESRFYPSLIRSDARLTYTEVRDMVVAEEARVIEAYSGIYPHLLVMKDLAWRLMEMRRRRGSLDFDLPAAEVVLDLRGRLEDIIRSERNLAHRMVEEFMLAANEAVATFLFGRGVPLLYRIHEAPDLEKMQAFQEFAAHFNYGMVLGREGVASRQLQKLLHEAEGRPEERMLNQVLLRSMKQARYDPDNVGHFGLAAELYCHFTSPIRRYPDLVVHRVLRAVLQQGGMKPGRRAQLQRSLPGTGEVTSQRERRAMEAEREIVDLKKCQHMATRVGEVFDGHISGVTPFGCFVELDDVFVEGLLHVSSLGDDFYHYEEELHRLIGEHRRRVFQIGGAVRVQVARVDLERRQIDFSLEEEGDPLRRRKKMKNRPKKAVKRV